MVSAWMAETLSQLLYTQMVCYTSCLFTRQGLIPPAHCYGGQSQAVSEVIGSPNYVTPLHKIKSDRETS